jgi:hypothetical protein
MGSGNKRKVNDHVRINVPASTAAVAGGNGGVDINQVCPMAFDVALQRPVDAGLSVSIDDSGNMIASSQTIGKLSAARLKQLATCSIAGIRYEGRTEVSDGNKYFVRFRQHH